MKMAAGPCAYRCYRNYHELNKKKLYTTNQLLIGNPDYLLHNLSELIPIIKSYNEIN